MSVAADRNDDYLNPHGWMDTYVGYRVYLQNPEVAVISFRDIAHALGMQCRFNGHTTQFYSVAEHCVKVADVLKHRGNGARIELLGLLHDAAEAYTGDVIRGMKLLLSEMQRIEAGLMRVIYETVGVAGPDEAEETVVKAADNTMVVVEARRLMPRARLATAGVGREASEVECWEPRRAELEWMDRYKKLTEVLHRERQARQE